ncbi:hypothetical protein, partial [Pectinatus brassicae]
YPGKRQFKRAIPACHGQKPWARHGQRKLAATSSTQSIKEINSSITQLKTSMTNLGDKMKDNNRRFEIQAQHIEEIDANIKEINATGEGLKKLAKLME